MDFDSYSETLEMMLRSFLLPLKDKGFTDLQSSEANTRSLEAQLRTYYLTSQEQEPYDDLWNEICEDTPGKYPFKLYLPSIVLGHKVDFTFNCFLKKNDISLNSIEASTEHNFLNLEISNHNCIPTPFEILEKIQSKKDSLLLLRTNRTIENTDQNAHESTSKRNKI